MKYPRGILKKSSTDRDEIVINEEDIVKPKTVIDPALRGNGNFAGLGYFLNSLYTWQIIKDNLGYLILVATKKGGN